MRFGTMHDTMHGIVVDHGVLTKKAASLVDDEKEQFLNQAKETFNDATIEKLDSILTVQHLGVNKEGINAALTAFAETVASESLDLTNTDDIDKKFYKFIQQTIYKTIFHFLISIIYQLIISMNT
mgnify:CR=1 FL=1